MLQIRRSDERGYADHGWLRSFHTFSFADYHDPEHMGFGSLRVINEDRIEPGSGFGTHGHRDMEIISYEQKHFDAASKRGRLRLIASSDARDGSVLVHQDVAVYAALLDGTERVEHKLAPARKAFAQVARGTLTVNGRPLQAGDALKASGVAEIVFESGEHAEIILFDLA